MKREVNVIQTVMVEIDEGKFDNSFMQEFRESFYNFKTIDDHIHHLAQLYSRGIAKNDDFIEGYGLTEDMGIKFKTTDQYEEYA